MTDIFAVIDAVEKNLRGRGYHIYGTFLHGSQNYGLDLYTPEYQSDIDLKCFVIPGFDDLFYNRMVSTTEDNGFGGHVEIKDIRLMPSLLAKGNTAYLECLYTRWFRCRDGRIIDMRDRIVSERLPLVVKASYGMAIEKMRNLRHPFPTKEAILAKYGYDPKQLSHLARIYYLLKDILDEKKPMAEALRPDPITRQYLLGLKLGDVADKDVDSLAATFLKDIKAYADEYGSAEACKSLNGDIEKEIRSIVADVVKNDLGLK